MSLEKKGPSKIKMNYEKSKSRKLKAREGVQEKRHVFLKRREGREQRELCARLSIVEDEWEHRASRRRMILRMTLSVFLVWKRKKWKKRKVRKKGMKGSSLEQIQ